MGFCPKNTFLQLKHYIQWIYLTLLSTTYVQIYQITYVIFETISHFSQHNSSVSFQLKHYILSTNQPIKVQIFRLSTVPVKVHRIPHVIFQIKSQFVFKVWIFFQCHVRSFFCTFQAETLSAFGKSCTSKCKFPDLPLLTLKLTKFSSNFASLFSVMRHNSSLLFHLNVCMLWTNGSNQSVNFQTFNCSQEN